ncbi:unnamed protein product [Danaus chrysippus]|uniref:(African queen) hypothetical protein n=1 Tax=Danaus chrysippus TaxID=151541 RepID=A0A8J2R6Z9_9NEOP|nr:unnamed protein product [Danaus chrysippus]
MGPFAVNLMSNGNNYMSGEPRRKRELPARPNHILLYTIINPAYPITVISYVLNDTLLLSKRTSALGYLELFKMEPKMGLKLFARCYQLRVSRG